MRLFRFRPETSLANCLRPLAVAEAWDQDAIDILRMFTGANVDGNDLDRKYQNQLAAYVKAFKATTGEDAAAMTYHIDI